MENKTEFSKAAGKRLIKSETDLKVSESASITLLEELEEHAERVVETAMEFAEAAGRKTVRREDIVRALRTQA